MKLDRPPFIEFYISSWVDIICALVSILTFTLYYPTWNLRIRLWFIEREMARNKRKRERIN